MSNAVVPKMVRYMMQDANVSRPAKIDIESEREMLLESLGRLHENIEPGSAYTKNSIGAVSSAYQKAYSEVFADGHDYEQAYDAYAQAFAKHFNNELQAYCHMHGAYSAHDYEPDYNYECVPGGAVHLRQVPAPERDCSEYERRCVAANDALISNLESEASLMTRIMRSNGTEISEVKIAPEMKKYMQEKVSPRTGIDFDNNSSDVQYAIG